MGVLASDYSVKSLQATIRSSEVKPTAAMRGGCGSNPAPDGGDVQRESGWSVGPEHAWHETEGCGEELPRSGACAVGG